MNMLNSLDEFNPKLVRERVIHDLNQWLESQKPKVEWEQDELIDRVSKKYRDGYRRLQQLRTLEFIKDDGLFLQEVLWLRNISSWVARAERDEDFADYIQRARELMSDDESGALDRQKDQLAPAMQTLHTGLESQDAAKLAVALRLFDWTVRSTQLDELLQYPKSDPGDEDAHIPPPYRGIRGPGYKYYPWQVLMYGHGDAWECARVFILMARQQHIDAVMLAFDDGQPGTRPQPWLPAVFLNGQLYLFDIQLGLPIPGPEGRGIATLQQVRNDPSLLSVLDVEDEKYTEPRLDEVVALIDASTPYLSRRMKVLERHLTGENRMVVTVQPSKLAAKVKLCDGINQVALWTLPFENFLYRLIFDKQKETDPEMRRHYYFEEDSFDLLSHLVLGRHSHFRGEFEPNEEGTTLGAKPFYLQARIPEEEIDNLEKNEELQERLGFGKGENRTPVEVVREYKPIFKRMRFDAGYWLALAHYDSGDYSSAVNWIQRMREADKADKDWVWDANSRHNMARAHEIMGQLQKAIDLHRADDSPRRHGSLLRARELQRQMAGAKAD